MIFCGLAAATTATTVVVLALAFAIYAGLAPFWGPALAAAGVAGAFLLLVLMAGVVTLLLAGPKRRPKSEKKSLIAQLLDLIRNQPIMAATGAAGLGAVLVVLVRNPALAVSLISAFLRSDRSEKA